MSQQRKIIFLQYCFSNYLEFYFTLNTVIIVVPIVCEYLEI